MAASRPTGDVLAALSAAAPDAPAEIGGALCRVLAGPRGAAIDSGLRLAHLVGQAAHESALFTCPAERLSYSAGRLCAVWPRRFPTLASAAPFAGRPRALAGAVYGGRLGNRGPEDGWRYRGRGWIQLTGRANYRRFGRLTGLPLEDRPDLAARPAAAWAVAIAYLASRRRGGRSALQWADADDAAMVTRIVNGGLHGLAERRRLTDAALAALSPPRPVLRRGSRNAAVAALQHALARAGMSPGPVDGAFGPRTEAALRAFQAARGLAADGVAGPAAWRALTEPTQQGEHP